MTSDMSRKEVLGNVFKMVPPMLEKFHKGKHINITGMIPTVNMLTMLPSQASSVESQSLGAVKTTQELPTFQPWHPPSLEQIW